MACNLRLLLLLALSLALAIQFLSSEAALGYDECPHAHYPKLCLAIIQSKNESRDGNKAADGPIAINYATKFAVQAVNRMSLLKRLRLEEGKYLLNTISHCSRNYTRAINNLIDAQYAAGVGYHDQVRAWITAAMSEVQSCKRLCKVILIKPSSTMEYLVNTNKEFSKLLSIAEFFFDFHLENT